MLERDDGTLDPREEKRFTRGLLPEVERIRFSEIYGCFDPDDLRNDEKPPPEVLSALEDVLGDAVRGKEPRVKLRLHPWFRRWSLFERAGNPEMGDRAWRCFWVCGVGEGQEGYLPSDLHTSDHRYYELAHGPGCIGPYRMPDKSDFEMVWRTANRRREGQHKAQVKEHLRKNAEKEKANKSIWEQKTADALSYYDLDLMTHAARIFGSGQKPYSCSDVDPYENLKLCSPRYETEQRNGFVILRKKGDDAHEARVEAERVKQAEDQRSERDKYLEGLISEYSRRDLLRRAKASQDASIKGKRSL